MIKFLILSIEDPLKPVLKFVVPPGSPVVQTVVDQILAVHGQILSLRLEPFYHLVYARFPFLEARHRLPVT